MKRTYSQIVEQIESLKLEAEKLRQKEVDDVIARIKDAVKHYNLTAADLGFTGGTRAATARKPVRRGGRVVKNTAAKFRDAQGNTWGGRGPRPKWLRNALLEGKTLEDFAV